MSAKKVLVLLAEGFEEVEAVTPVDYLRRAGIQVTAAAVGKTRGEGLLVKGSHDIQIAADTTLESLAAEGKLDAAFWDGVVVPGGLPGADNLAASKETGAFLKAMAAAGKLVCAICASPARVLAPLGLLAGKKFTCYPGEEAKVLAADSPGAQWKEDRVVVDGAVITSRGAGTAGEFSCAIVAALVSEDAAEKLRGRLLLCC
ncbi:MAG: DJ-1/PfpI family protein [Treponema sp.]|nr:DJ-1/PfpI family protein [Treponema sp.]